MTHTAVALIVASPGPVRSSIQTLLQTIPEIEIVAEARDIEAVLDGRIELKPDLILLDADLCRDRLTEIIPHARRRWAHAHILVLAENESQRQAALTAGADAVLLAGFRAARFVALVREVFA